MSFFILPGKSRLLWTDLALSLILIGGVLTIFISGSVDSGGSTAVLEMAKKLRHFQQDSFSIVPTAQVSNLKMSKSPSILQYYRAKGQKAYLEFEGCGHPSTMPWNRLGTPRKFKFRILENENFSLTIGSLAKNPLQNTINCYFRDVNQGWYIRKSILSFISFFQK